MSCFLKHDIFKKMLNMMTSIFSGQTYHNSDADLAHCKKNGTFEIAGKTDYPLTIVNT